MPMGGGLTTNDDWDLVADKYDSFYSRAIHRHEDRVVERVLKRVALSGIGGAVLDLGCGTGNGLRALQCAKGYSPREYCGVDSSAGLLEKFWHHNTPTALGGGVGVRLLNRRGEDEIPSWGAVAASWVLVLALWSLYYFDEDQLERTLRNVASVTDPGARFIATAFVDSSGRVADHVCGPDVTLKSDFSALRLALLQSGWDVVRVSGISGPLSRFLGRFSRHGLAIADRIDRVLHPHPESDSWRFVVIEAQRAEGGP